MTNIIGSFLSLSFSNVEITVLFLAMQNMRVCVFIYIYIRTFENKKWRSLKDSSVRQIFFWKFIFLLLFAKRNFSLSLSLEFFKEKNQRFYLSPSYFPPFSFWFYVWRQIIVCCLWKKKKVRKGEKFFLVLLFPFSLSCLSWKRKFGAWEIFLTNEKYYYSSFGFATRNKRNRNLKSSTRKYYYYYFLLNCGKTSSYIERKTRDEEKFPLPLLFFLVLIRENETVVKFLWDVQN